jgi:hypothetical protein
MRGQATRADPQKSRTHPSVPLRVCNRASLWIAAVATRPSFRGSTLRAGRRAKRRHAPEPGPGVAQGGPEASAVVPTGAEPSLAAAMPFESADYYAPIAQVIPVLFILMAVELRVVVAQAPGVPEDQVKDFAVLIVIGTGWVATAALGEGCALWALAERRATTQVDVFTIGALAVAGFLVLTLPMGLCSHGSLSWSTNDFATSWQTSRRR